jgi:hypothetical protein
MSGSPMDEASLDATPDEALRTRNQRDGRFRCVTRRKRETRLPGWAGRLPRPRTVITRDELWHDPWADGTRVYDIATTVANVPVTIRGQGPVSPAGMRSCRYHLDAELSTRAPGIGTRREALVAERLDRTATGEPELGTRWPAQRV